MCGIVGYFAFDRHREVPQAVVAGLGALAHRGPDDEGTWQDEGVLLGMRRLSIIDLAGGHQPIWNADHTCCIVYNGELYNYRDLRPELEALGSRFATQSDTEVVLAAYEQWGPECLRRCNGMFAFAIWDGRRDLLFVARDRIGEKPLYYTRNATRLAFASEIKALLCDPELARRLDVRGLANYLAFGHGCAPLTIFQDVQKLLPGHYLLVSRGGVQAVCYWDVGEQPEEPVGPIRDEAVAAERLLALLDDAVRRRMIADVPVGAFLSGGVDSSAIVALMRRHASGPVKTFSLGFTIGGGYNELSDAQQAAAYYGTEHHELLVEHVDLVQTLETLVYHYDEPFADSAGFPLYLLSRFARDHVKVVLTGDGGDELFGGYRRYAADLAAAPFQRMPRAVQTWLAETGTRLPRARRLKRALQTLGERDPGRRYTEWLLLFSPALQEELLRPQVRAELGGYDPTRCLTSHYGRLKSASRDHLNQMMYVDLKTWLADTYMEKTDKATMACGLEARLPLLDYRLVELAFQMPGALKVQGWSTKRIFKTAVAGLVPETVLRKRKHGFAVPTDPWFRGELKEYAFDLLLGSRAASREYFNMEVVERLWREHAQGRAVWDEHLWVLLNFEVWQRTFLDPAAPVASPAPVVVAA